MHLKTFTESNDKNENKGKLGDDDFCDIENEEDCDCEENHTCIGYQDLIDKYNNIQCTCCK